MTCWVVIPVKSPGKAKSRLAEVLDEGQRESLASAMLARVTDAARGAANVDRVALLGPSSTGIDTDLPLLADPGGGLNPALQHTLANLPDPQIARLIVLFADLPRIARADVERLAAAGGNAIAIAPDHHGTGTNALSLPIPAARGFTFAFGPDSFARHRAEAGRLGLRIEDVRSPGLAHDIDVPEDLAGAEALISRKT